MHYKGKFFKCKEEGHFTYNYPKKKTAANAHAIVTRMSDELKDLLRQDLFTEADVERKAVEDYYIEEVTPIEESNINKENVIQSQ